MKVGGDGVPEGSGLVSPTDREEDSCMATQATVLPDDLPEPDFLDDALGGINEAAKQSAAGSLDDRLPSP
jgi:hypothetical protein